MEGIPDTKFQMKEIWKVLGKYDKIEKSPTDVPTWEIWKVPMKYKTAEKSFEQYDMLLVSIGHFSSNIGHILVAREQSPKDTWHNICWKGKVTNYKEAWKDLFWTVAVWQGGLGGLSLFLERKDYLMVRSLTSGQIKEREG